MSYPAPVRTKGRYVTYMRGRAVCAVIASDRFTAMKTANELLGLPPYYTPQPPLRAA